jgi:hypothetical protein
MEADACDTPTAQRYWIVSLMRPVWRLSWNCIVVPQKHPSNSKPFAQRGAMVSHAMTLDFAYGCTGKTSVVNCISAGLSSL